MTERHPYVGELTVKDVDKYLAMRTRDRIISVLADEGGLNADIVALRAGFLGVPVRDVLAAMIDDGTVVRLAAERDADGSVIRPRGLYLHDGDAG